MSTATLDPTVAALPFSGHPGWGTRPAAGPRRGHLRLVPVDGNVGAAATATASTATASIATAATDKDGASPLRITRRGRLALTTTATLVVALVMLSLMGVMGPAGATTSVVVQPGMTLSQIAAEQLPGVPLSKAVTDIQRANKLSTPSIAVGQELVIPAR